MRGNILKAFEATGVAPPSADAVLRRFKTTTPQQDEDLDIEEHGDGNTWDQLRNLFDAVVKNAVKVEAKWLSASLYSMQVQNELLYHENEGLCTTLSTVYRHSVKSKSLELQQRKEICGAVATSSSVVASPPPQPLVKTTTRRRQIKLPGKQISTT
ncbi:hypothetical protein PtrSN002B_011237 [Pyrenophora tritici-repentis]|uniref:Uncharacterized protein n=2 Tax=Pyrenophora tritici-repentis TaxID=45151 RepID=A0A2W1G848_9PLEO|nr:uncharacterized protein PTRG_08141 [Pyrenophora tritici-repentis Pt-1C-BFP]KAA8615935.1 hypothetical protein PtrV1_11331 [Pyrenophora tritici-repentis]EDU51060.1 conserved hypothetical protein [Pyrenophora tritici-repentis Pt-1C-BFP]KAF7443473.1 hypothetical protein A1F99_115470 [Pyrenophora tritici-repentis]KAF7566818.1 hypothetical protein PtrM4_151380 [Pyrenophora tritici-repentis]KAG9379209.1 hypothetical protein A1F94_009565 [Pyrenophora tritici-repentis]